MRQIALNIAALSLLLVFGAHSASAQSAVEQQGRVISVKGNLSVTRASQPSRMIGVNDLIGIGDELVTDERSEAVIQTSGGATIHIYPDSRVILNGQSSRISDFLHLFFGSIKVHVEKLSGRPNPHSLTTPTAVIAVRGTTFSVFVDDMDATMVAVDEGLVAVFNHRSPRDEVLLHPGQRTWVRGNQPPIKAQKFRGHSEHADMMPARHDGMDKAMNNSGMGRAMDPMSGGGAAGGMTGMPSHH